MRHYLKPRQWARAPITMRSTKDKPPQLYYWNGIKVPNYLFPRVNGTKLRFLHLSDPAAAEFAFVRTKTGIDLNVYDCNKNATVVPHFCSNKTATFACERRHSQTSQGPVCSAGLRRMDRQVDSMQTFIQQLFPLLPAEGKQSPGIKKILKLEQKYLNSTTDEVFRHKRGYRTKENAPEQSTIEDAPPGDSKFHLVRNTRAVGFLIGGLFAASIANAGTSIVHGGSISSMKSAINAANAGIREQQTLNEKQNEEIITLANFITDLYETTVENQQTNWYEKKIIEIQSRFDDTVLTAGTAINRLGIIQLAQGQNQVLPFMLTSDELALIAEEAFAEQYITLSVSTDEVDVQLWANGTDLQILYHIPVVEEERLFNFFKITPIPAYHQDGIQVVPKQWEARAAFQSAGRGFLIPSQAEHYDCTHPGTKCTVASPVNMQENAPCGVASFYPDENEVCEYEPTNKPQNFFYTVGNFTCFSVDQKLDLGVFCRNPDKYSHAASMKEGKITLSDAGCFSFSRKCYLKSENGQLILPSNKLGTVLKLNDLTLSQSEPYTVPAMITPDLPPDLTLPAVSAIKQIARNQNGLPRVELMDIPQTPRFAWSSMAIGVVVLLLAGLLIKMALAFRNHRSKFTEKWNEIDVEYELLKERLKKAGALASPSIRSIATLARAGVPSVQSLQSILRTPTHALSRSRTSLNSVRTQY